MSFYAHPFQRRQAPASHAAHYPFATAPGVTTQPSFNFFTAPHSPAPAPAPASTPDYAFYDTIDAEEQAALAHLRSIQQRREAAQAAARREAALQAHLAARQEAAYAALVERHLIEQKQQQQQQEAAARAIAFEQHRRAQIAAAQREIVQREVARRELAQREFARRAIAIEQRKAAEEEWIKKRNACARRCAGGCANVKKNEEKPKVEKKEEHDEWKEMNEVLASLFGFNFAQPQEAKKEQAPAPVAKPEVKADQKPADKIEQPAPPAPQPADAKPASPKPESSDAPKPAQLDLNDLLSTFLGMSLEPAKADDKPTENADQLTAKLNDFLSQFGLEFESIDSVEKSTKAESSSAAAAKNESASAPAKADAPTAASTAAPNPADKGKSVAEGERPTRSTETTAAFNKLRDISHELHLATESFTFPSKLSFADTVSSDATPALLFNKGNSGYHAQAHKLLQLLLAADGISSGGDREVRKQRKAIVKAIEGAIEQLEQKRDEVWREVKEKREMGAEVSDDESVSSWNSTEVEHVENADGQEQEKDEEVKEKTEETTYAETAAGGTEDKPAEQPEVKAEETEVKGFEVPGEESSGTETKVKATLETETETKEAREGKEANAKEDEFELL